MPDTSVQVLTTAVDVAQTTKLRRIDLVTPAPSPMLLDIQVIGGPRGYTGPPGPQGVPGPVGPPGTIAYVVVSATPPPLVPNTFWFDSVSTQLFIGYDDGVGAPQWVIANNLSSGGSITYPQLPIEVQQLPISIPFAGKPTSGSLVNVPMTFPVTVPNGLAGTVTYASLKASTNAIFLVNRITVAGALTQIGTVTFTTGVTQLSGSGGALAAGDVLQVVAPGIPNGTLADIGITIMANRT